MMAGVIGLGAMGAGMARNLAKHDLLATVWNRTAATGEALAAELGLPAAARPEDLAAECDVIIICVSADADVLEMVDAILPALATGKIVIDTSTVGVDTAREAARRVAGAGADFLDTPVSGGREGAESGTLAAMVGGDPQALTAAMPVLAAMTRSVTHMGDSGQGQAAKAVNQIMAAGIAEAVSEALAFGADMGLDMDRLIEAVGGGAAGNWFLSHRGPSMARGSYQPGFRAALHHKDLVLCQRMLDQRGVSLPIVEMAIRHYQRLMDEGHGDEDISALYRLKRRMFEQGNKRSL